MVWTPLLFTLAVDAAVATQIPLYYMSGEFVATMTITNEEQRPMKELLPPEIPDKHVTYKNQSFSHIQQKYLEFKFL